MRRKHALRRTMPNITIFCLWKARLNPTGINIAEKKRPLKDGLFSYETFGGMQLDFVQKWELKYVRICDRMNIYSVEMR